MLSTAKEHQIEVDIGNGGNSAESQGEEADESELDELDLFPGGLELPPMRSPRGIKNYLLFLFGKINTPQECTHEAGLKSEESAILESQTVCHQKG